jgi:hypothetical protein
VSEVPPLLAISPLSVSQREVTPRRVMRAGGGHCPLGRGSGRRVDGSDLELERQSPTDNSAQRSRELILPFRPMVGLDMSTGR